MDEGHAETWETSDLTTAAYLRCLGIRYLTCEDRDGNAVWTFAKTERLTKAMAEFAMGEARVDPERMIGTYMGLRNIMYQTLDGEPVSADGRN